MYATDASHYQMMPRVVVVPADEDDVVATMAVARETGVPITGRGGGTSLAGQTFGTGIVIDFSKHLNQLLEVNEAAGWARVQPGIVRDQLNKKLKDTGLHFGPDPATSSRATLGGMINNNSSGTRSIVFGKTIDNVLALKVLLADGTTAWLDPRPPEAWRKQARRDDRLGEIFRGVGKLIAANHDEIDRRFPKVMRRVGGYNLDYLPTKGTATDAPPDDATPWNLAHLICGSEGTLGLVLEAKVKLVPLPGATALCIVHFHDLIEALRPVPAMLEHGPSAVELLDRIILREARINPSSRGYADFIDGDPEAVQIVEFSGDDQSEATAKAERFAADMAAKGVGYARVLRTDPANVPGGIPGVWELRRLGVGLQSNVKGRVKPLDFVDDACVPVEKLAAYIEKLRTICTKHGVEMPICAHASVGVLHPKPALDLHREEDRAKMKAIAWEAFELVKSYGGAWSGEHGDGLVRGEFVRAFFGEQLYEAFRQLKRLFDPENLLNPGKILDTPGMTEHLRHGTPGYEQRIAEVKANYHYRDQGGFALAVEQCNGVGACRKLDVGVMCPSYMATRDEEATTRGRANALRLAMSGQLGDDGLAGDGVADALELCLACKACKVECPNAVDMAKLKSDVLQMRHDQRGLPLGARLMGEAPQAAKRIAGPLAPIVNAVQRLGPYKWLMQRVAGVDARRPFPTYANKPLHKQLEKRTSATIHAPAGVAALNRTGGQAASGTPAPSGRAGKVVLFNDTYMNYHEPQIGLRAVELLEGCGYEVILANAGCCQRPRLSKGMVRDAKRDGLDTLRNLAKFTEQGLPILFCEPSCASAIMDDLPDLIDPPELGEKVKQACYLLDTFLAQQVETGAIDVTIEATSDEVLIHGHCHQKSLTGTAGMHTLLNRVEGLTVSEVDAGCCGMAGSFGYEHYDVSMAIGSQRLFPAAKDAQQRDAAVCANGFSCRHQLADGCGVEGKHLVELIRVKRPGNPG
ncbi:MAG: FAD-binding protein [Planctomycetes bacterium]|nr:FAD-binding protein [Planctomycetota bacterium]